jgi:hypothetical protein
MVIAAILAGRQVRQQVLVFKDAWAAGYTFFEVSDSSNRRHSTPTDSSTRLERLEASWAKK